MDANPFPSRGVDPKELHVSFLSAKPPAKKIAALDPGHYAPGEFEFGERVIYVRLPNGVMGSRLPDWEKVLGVTVTTRNWNTATRLRQLAEG